MWRQYNPNPTGNKAGDCAVRAICKATGKPWEEVYIEICMRGLMYGDWGSNNSVWGSYLRDMGFVREPVPCDRDCTVESFAAEHPKGTYILALSGHTVTIENGDWFDSWDSGQCVPIFYWIKKREE